VAYTSNVGKAQIGSLWIGSDDIGAGPPPFDPGSVPWYVAANNEAPPVWRRRTQESFARGPELPQPILDPSTFVWPAAVNSGEPPPWRRITQESVVRITELSQPPLNPSTVSPQRLAWTYEQEVVPRWRYRTQESYAEPFFPSSIPTQQLNLVSKGIRHRKLGIWSLSGGVQGLLVFIAGVNQTGTFAALTARITRQLQTTGNAQAVFNVPAGGFTPQLGASILISENGTTLFAGIINKRKHEIYPNTTMSKWTVDCVDWNGLMQRHLLARNYPVATLASITQDMMLQPTINLDRVSTAAVDPGLVTADSTTYPYWKYSDVLNDLGQATDAIWWIDNTKNLHFILPANAPTSTFSVTENGQQVSPDVIVEDSLDNYRNKQYLRTSQTILSESVTLTESHTFSGSPADVGFATKYPLLSAPSSVKENGVELVGTNRFFKLNASGPSNYPPYPPTTGYYWIEGGYGIFAWPTTVPPTAGTVVSVTYTGSSTYQGNVVVFADSTEIANQAAISGGSGIFEEIEDYSGSLTYTQALAIAQGTEQATAPPPDIVTINTVELVEDIGYKVTVNLPRWGVNASYVIQQMDLIDQGATLGKGTRFMRKLQLVSARTLGNYTQFWERLFGRLNKALVSVPVVGPSWELATDKGPNLSAGLAVGLYQSATVQVSIGKIAAVSAYFRTAADATIIIDITLNGQSIFDSTRLQYRVAQTGITELYGNFNPNNINVKQGDVLTLSIIACGTLSPGKNGFVQVYITQS